MSFLTLLNEFEAVNLFPLEVCFSVSPDLVSADTCVCLLPCDCVLASVWCGVVWGGDMPWTLRKYVSKPDSQQRSGVGQCVLFSPYRLIDKRNVSRQNMVVMPFVRLYIYLLSFFFSSAYMDIV